MKEGRYLEITNRLNICTVKCEKAMMLSSYIIAGSNSYAPVGVSPDWLVFRKWKMTKEPDEGNLHVRVCGEGAGQPALLPGTPIIYAVSKLRCR